MANFDPAIALVLKNEGSTYTAVDGNPTKYGLTLSFLQAYGLDWDKVAVADMSQEQAIAIYKSGLWDKYGFAKLSNQLVGNYLFDMAVNMGVAEAVTLAQRAIWAATQSLRCKVDGVLGDVTVGDINNASQCYLPILRMARIEYYLEVVNRNADKAQFLPGWLARAIEVCI